ncbi:MAG: hypothetical protein AUJ98_00490 [Bacteroidetes bacterium CG2_30_33_31]|nr:MAG: hypothetical protein AUJ98_00490 [Bacteroidetes bacterium CG2_30_33_31]
MKKHLTFIFLLVFNIGIFAQVTYEKRIELELNDNFDKEDLVAFGKEGCLLISSDNDATDGLRNWKYQLLNTDLEIIKTETINLSRKLYLKEKYSSKQISHEFFIDQKGNYTLLSIAIPSIEITKISGSIPKKSYVKDMAVLGDFAFFISYLKKTPYLFSINWKTGTKKLIPLNIKGISSKKISIINFQLLENSNEIFVYLKAIKSKKESNVYIIRLIENGDKTEVFNLTKELDKNITSISTSNCGEDKYIFTGTYSASANGMSEGIFFCKTLGEKIEFIKYYNFLDLDNFLSYLPDRKKEKIEQKKKRKDAKGKEFSINYMIANHDIMPLNDGYLFLGEAYYPTYRTETYQTTIFINGRAQMQTQFRTVFDGYQYTHAVVAKIDLNGKIIWDKTFDMWPSYKPYFGKKFISVAKHNNNLKLVFVSRNKIISEAINYEGEISNKRESEELQTGLSGDKVKYAFSNIDFWYDNYFLTNGSQKIKNSTDKSVKRKRKVYFISKIKY